MAASSERCGTGRRSGYAEVKPLTDCLLARLGAELDERLVAVALYGSVARGEARAESDIDLFLVYRGDGERVADTFVEVELELRAAPLTAELQARGVPTNPMPVFRSEAALIDTPWLLLDVSHHGIILFDLLRIRRRVAGARGAAADARRIQRLCARIAADIERAAAARQEQAGGDREPPAGAAD